MGDCILGWSCLYNFLKTPGLTLPSDVVFNADHDHVHVITFTNVCVVVVCIGPCRAGPLDLKNLRLLTSDHLAFGIARKRLQHALMISKAGAYTGPILLVLVYSPGPILLFVVLINFGLAWLCPHHRPVLV